MWQEGTLGFWGIKDPVDINPGDGSSRQVGAAVKVRIIMIAPS